MLIRYYFSLQMKFAALFDFSLVTDMFRTCLRRREHFERSVIWLTMLALVGCIFVMSILFNRIESGRQCSCCCFCVCLLSFADGSDTVFYMFVREKFEWTILQYNAYSSTAILTQVVGNLFGVYVLVKVHNVFLVALLQLDNHFSLHCSTFA